MMKNRLILLMFIILSGVLVTFRGGAISYTLFTICLLIPVVAALYMFYIFFQFRIYQNIGSKTIRKFDKVNYSFILANEDVISYSSVRVTFLGDEKKPLASIDNIDVGRCYYLLPGESYTYNTTIICNCMGEYKIGVDKVILNDFFKLFKFHYSLPSKLEVTVLPRLIMLDSLCFYSREEGKVINPSYSNQIIPDVDLRKYIRGDSRKTIHWKASAKAHELMTRRYTEEPKSEIMLLPDLSMIDKEETEKLFTADHVIETTLAIAGFFVREQTVLTVGYWNKNQQFDSLIRKTDLDVFYKKACRLSFREEHNTKQLILKALERAARGSIFVIIIHSEFDGLRNLLFRINRSGHEVVLIIVNSHPEVIAECANGLKVNCICINLDEDVETVLTGKKVENIDTNTTKCRNEAKIENIS